MLETGLSRRSAVAAMAAMAAGTGHAQPWPARPVQLFVPAAPGGPVSDTAAVLAAALGRRWRQRVLPQFVPGAGTINGALAVARSHADGYHLGLATTALAINAALRSALPYGTLVDLTPVSQLASFQYGFFANRKLPLHDVADLIAYAKRSRTPVAYASPGIGTGPHLAAESFAYEAGIHLAHTPFSSFTPAENAVVAGELPLLAVGLSSSIAASANGKLRLVALLGSKVPAEGVTVSWASDAVPGFEVSGMLGAIAPRGLPPALLDQLGRDLAATVQQPEVRTALAQVGMTALGSLPSQYDVQLRSDIARWRLVGRVTGIRLD